MEVGSNVLSIIGVLNVLPDGVSIQISVNVVHALWAHQREEGSASLSLFLSPILVGIRLTGLGFQTCGDVEDFVGVEYSQGDLRP